VVWQTGSGTQTNMNVNEVLANRASELLGDARGKAPVHPNDHVNKSQSSNDVLPHRDAHRGGGGGEHRAAASAAHSCAARWRQGGAAFMSTSSRSAAPTCRTPRRSRWARNLGWVAQLEHTPSAHPRAPAAPVRAGAGRHRRGHRAQRPAGFAEAVAAANLARPDRLPFVTAPNKFEALASCTTRWSWPRRAQNAGRGLMKIANDVRWLASGPRAGLGESPFPRTSRARSIMPGKVNPTQCEALTMLAARSWATTWPSASAAARAISS
jgi:fumarate hydratase class II